MKRKAIMKKGYFSYQKEKTKALYDKINQIYNPYLQNQIIFNSNGFHHLRFSARKERNKKEQLLKFSLLPLAIIVIKNSGTLQEYRKGFLSMGDKARDGFWKTKLVEYWGFVAIVGKSKIKIRVVLRKVGDGIITFWSVMPYSKIKFGQRLYTPGIDDEN
ncbi:MAG: hypothetical protein Q8P32_02525 [Candidatus Komeilibacteria bacterium]|nr:hypothetical protein [Candidatus Komeilibacteria bacterium]